LGGPAPARGRRAGPRGGSAAPAHGRALRCPRPDRATRAPARVPGLEAAPRQDRDPRHARRAGGIPTGRPGRCHGLGPSHAGRHAVRDPFAPGGRVRPLFRDGGGGAVTGLLGALWERRAEIAVLTGEHVLLVLAATVLAVGIGVPLGVGLTR